MTFNYWNPRSAPVFSLQAIDCTGTDNQTQSKQKNIINKTETKKTKPTSLDTNI